MARKPRRWLAMTGVGVAVVLMATLVLYTDVGAPRDHYAAPPDPCPLLHALTTRELTGDISWSRLSDTPSGNRVGLYRYPHIKRCAGPVLATNRDHGRVTVHVWRFYSAQFRLGATGKQRAADLLESQIEGFRERRYRDGCTYEVDGDHGRACGMHNDSGLAVLIQQDNLYVTVLLHFQASFKENPDPLLDEMLATLTQEILSQLDSNINV